MVHIAGLEPARDFSHYHLKVARLPIPPYVREKDENIKKKKKMKQAISMNAYHSPKTTKEPHKMGPVVLGFF